MKTATRLLLCLLALVAIARAQVSDGMKLADLLAAHGPPESIAEGPKKAIYRWSDLQVTVVGGVVTQWRGRDPEEERHKDYQRAKAVVARQQQYEKQQESRPVVIAQAPAPSPVSASPAMPYLAQGSTAYTKEERIAELHAQIEQCRRVKENYFLDYSKPDNRRRVSAAMRDLAVAQMARYEQYLADVEK